tara:strand:+ start:5373 stop:5630 length:258 start_codon:yes stop_codon:yes gene_type:complete
MSKVNQHVSYDYDKLLQLLELYLKSNTETYKDDTTYVDREYLKEQYPNAVSSVTTMPLTMESVQKALKWQEQIQSQFQGMLGKKN